MLHPRLPANYGQENVRFTRPVLLGSSIACSEPASPETTAVFTRLDNGALATKIILGPPDDLANCPPVTPFALRYYWNVASDYPSTGRYHTRGDDVVVLLSVGDRPVAVVDVLHASGRLQRITMDMATLASLRKLTLSELDMRLDAILGSDTPTLGEIPPRARRDRIYRKAIETFGNMSVSVEPPLDAQRESLVETAPLVPEPGGWNHDHLPLSFWRKRFGVEPSAGARGSRRPFRR